MKSETTQQRTVFHAIGSIHKLPESAIEIQCIDAATTETGEIFFNKPVRKRFYGCRDCFFFSTIIPTHLVSHSCVQNTMAVRITGM